MNSITFIQERNGQPVTTSRKVAEVFGKEHKNVLKDIETLDCSNDFSRLNFELSNYKVRGKLYPEYNMTKDGFTFLVMGYRGKKASKFKETYIQQFNEMEDFIKSLQQAKLEFPAFTDAIMNAHEKPMFYHYVNEINMINKIVLGVTASKFKELNGIDKKVNSIRPYLSVEQILKIEELQRIDIGLIIAKLSCEQRKEILTNHYSMSLLRVTA
ncbi:MAG: Rha family transcriptional regulator [Lachnotalea sp.]